MRKRFDFLVIAAGTALFAAPLTAAPADANADEFYRDAKELNARGMRAMFDKRTKPRMAQIKDAAETVKAANEVATKAGKPLYCVPSAARKKGIDVDFIVSRLGAIPESRRKTMTLKKAWRQVLVTEYPCN